MMRPLENKSSNILFKGVRISPASLVLKNGYDGKRYNEKITFQNLNASPVIIQTEDPTYSV